ncbi:MarR family winged helix-turn-helix transcriptional regulator [Streptomyces sp. NPDC006622]|uniref:MarR family winged helix-turn-helix transcriptional regulator n=1 Tax=Streptomyces sp. NPDC006622 TaxID=3155459 RepID=UPI0033BE6B35
MVRDREPRPPSPERPLGHLLGRAHSRLTRMTAEALAPHGVDGHELTVLAVLADGEVLSQADAAARLGVDRTTMVSLIDGLEDHALVERRRSPHDRRRNLVTLTPLGEECLRQAERARRAAEHLFLAPLDEQTAAALRRALGTLVPEERPPVPLP